VDYWITVDRDAHPDGISGIYDQVKDEFWKAVDAGKTPGLRTLGSGTDSSNCPLVAVGNSKCNGTNPPKYLDAAIDDVKVQDANGEWVSVAKGGSVEVCGNKPVLARIEFTNLGEAKLLSPAKSAKPGAVHLVVRSGGKETRTPISADVAHLRSAVVKDVILAPAGLKSAVDVVVSFDAQDRTPFGERFTVRLLPI
jgi:hypothetical protein